MSGPRNSRKQQSASQQDAATSPPARYESFADLAPQSPTSPASTARRQAILWPQSRSRNVSIKNDNSSRQPEHVPNTLDLVYLTMGLAGAQLTWTVEMAFGTPYLLGLGLTKESTSLVWLAGPLSGLLVQPIVGAISDSSQSRYRRRFFIAGSAILVIASTLFVAYARELAAMLSSLSGLGDWDPSQEERIKSTAIVIGVSGFYVLDFSLNGLQASLRALILDQSPGHLQNVANAWHGRMTHIGNILGYLAGYIDLGHWSGISWVGGGQFRKLAVISCIVMVICVTVTCWTQVEEQQLSDVVGTGSRGASIQWRKAYRNVRDTIRDLPIPVRRVCYVQFCAWSAWFPFLFYSTSWVAQVLYNSIPPGEQPPSADTATRAGSLALLLYAIVAFASGAVLPWISTLGRKRVIGRRISRATKTGMFARRVLCLATPRNFWTTGLALYALCMVSTFWVHTVAGAMTVIAFLGIPWSITCWVPFALVMESIRELDNTSDDESDSGLAPGDSIPSTPPSKRSPHSQPFRASLQRQPSLSTVAGAASPARNQLDSALTECSPLLEGQGRGTPKGTRWNAQQTSPRRMLARKSRSRDPPDQQTATGGTILGIHNLAIVAPQFVVSLVAAGIFKLLEHHHRPDLHLSGEPSSPWNSSMLASTSKSAWLMSEPGPGLRGQNDVVWVLRFGGFASLIGVIVSRWVLPTRSELEYREFVMQGGDADEQDDEATDGGRGFNSEP